MRLFKKPVLCNYYVTYRCNATCSFCDIWERPSPYVTLENARENLTDLAKLGVKVIDFTGGEPLLHRQIVDLLGIAKSLGFVPPSPPTRCCIPKMQSGFKDWWICFIFRWIQWTGQNTMPQRGVDCFDHLQRSITLAQELGEHPDILFTVTDENVAEIPALYQEYVQVQKLHVILNPMFEYNSVGKNLDEATLQSLYD